MSELTKDELLLLSILDKPRAEIVRQINYSPKTIDNRLKAIREKLGVKSTLQAVIVAFRKGLIK